MVVVAVLVAIATFFCGIKYDQSQNAGQKGGGNYAQGQGRNGGMSGNRAKGGGFTTGEVLSMDDKSVTLKLQNGGSKIVLLSDKTQVMKSIEGSKADLKTGENLMVTGVANADGSVTAENIQIRPAQTLTAPKADTSVAK